MDWTELVPFIAVLGVLAAMWWRLDSKIETRIGRLEALLTDNLHCPQSRYRRAERRGAHPHPELKRRRAVFTTWLI